MSFSYLTRYKARFRQRGHCALCGERLDDTEEFTYHLWPESQGGPDREENFVILCQNCHSIVHSSAGYQSCYIAPLTYFPYANIYGSHSQPQARASRTR